MRYGNESGARLGVSERPLTAERAGRSGRRARDDFRDWIIVPVTCLGRALHGG